MDTLDQAAEAPRAPPRPDEGIRPLLLDPRGSDADVGRDDADAAGRALQPAAPAAHRLEAWGNRAGAPHLDFDQIEPSLSGKQRLLPRPLAAILVDGVVSAGARTPVMARCLPVIQLASFPFMAASAGNGVPGDGNARKAAFHSSSPRVRTLGFAAPYSSHARRSAAGQRRTGSTSFAFESSATAQITGEASGGDL